MSVSDTVVRNIVKKLILGEDHRDEVINMIDAEFLNYTAKFFKKFVEVKHSNADAEDWYENSFLSQELPNNDIIVHAGLAQKTIFKIYGSTHKDIVVQAAKKHFHSLKSLIQQLTHQEQNLEFSFSLRAKEKSVQLSKKESLILINTLATKRSQIREGTWSAVGKRAEQPLMRTLCKLYSIEEDFYLVDTGFANPTYRREVDFILIGPESGIKCEVKLMGEGNPENVDAVNSKDTQVFVADKLSDLVRNQLNDNNIKWVELNGGGFRKFGEVLRELDFNPQEPPKNIRPHLESVLDEVFSYLVVPFS